MPPPATVTLGNTDYRIERPSGLKASRALALMRALSRAMPELTGELARFRRDYERDNVLELDRVQARMRYPAEPLVRDGKPLTNEAGDLLMLPSPVDRLTEADWEAAGGVYRVSASPGWGEVLTALFDRALELAESHVYRLLALFTIPNDELKALRKGGGVDDALEQRAELLLDDSYFDELLELAVVVGETVDHHFRRKTADLGDRVGNALRLIGLDWTTKATPDEPPTPATSTEDPPTPTPSTDGPSSSKPSSSTGSPDSTDGSPTPPSTSPSTDSSSSEQSSTSEPNANGSRTPTPV